MRGDRVTEQGLARNIGDREIVAGGKVSCLAEPAFLRDVAAAHARITIGPAIGDDVALQVTEPKIEIDGIGAENDAEPLARMRARCFIQRGNAVHHGAVGRPPAHVARAFVEIAIDNLDRVKRKIHEAGALRLARHPPHQRFQLCDLATQLLFQRPGDGRDLAANVANLLRDDRESPAGFTGACRLDHRVERQDAHPRRNLLDLGHLLDGERVDLASQRRDVCE